MNITPTPSENFYLNTGSISLKAVETNTNTDLSTDSSIIWNAKLLYGGVDINGYGDYYKLFKDSNNKWVVQISNKLATAGTYQLYVTATYEGITNSRMMNVYVKDGELYEYNLASPNDEAFADFMTNLEKDIMKISSTANIIFAGSLNSTPETAEDQFSEILYAISQTAHEFTLDMAELTGITGIPENAYICSPVLTSIVLPNSFTKLKANAFTYTGSGCDKLTSIIIPGTITTIEPGAFAGCPLLADINITGDNSKYNLDDNGCFYEIDGDEKTLSYVPPTYLASLTNLDFATDFPGITKFNAGVFAETQITSITSFGDITDIPEHAFYGSTLTGDLDLTGINSIGEYAFAGTAITSITSFGNITEIPAYAFNDSEIEGTIDLTGITSIGDHAFYDCSNLEGIRNYGSLTHVGSYAFSNVKTGKLDELTFSSPNIEIESWGISVTTLNIGFDITSENYETIRDNFFSGFGYVTNVVLNGQTVLPDLLESELVGGAISGNSNKHPKALFNKFNPTTITFNNTTDFKIGDYQFAKNSSLQSIITNGGKIKEVGNYAFYSNNTGYSANKISNIDLSACTKIGDYAFYECPYFTNTLDLSNVQYIGEQAFLNKTWKANTSSYTYHCKASKINLKNAKSIGYRAFFGWTGLTTIEELGTNVEEGCVIGDEAFAFYNITGSGGTNNTLRMGLHTINSTTAYTADLSHVKIIGAGAFRNCSFDTKTEGSKTTVIISSDVIAIGTCAFYPNAMVTSYPTNMTFASMPDGKTGTWYEVKYSSSNSPDRKDLWNQIVAGTKNAFTTDDISSYQTTLGTANIVQVSDTTTIKSSIISQSDTTGSYYIRVITSN